MATNVPTDATSSSSGASLAVSAATRITLAGAASASSGAGSIYGGSLQKPSGGSSASQSGMNFFTAKTRVLLISTSSISSSQAGLVASWRWAASSASSNLLKITALALLLADGAVSITEGEINVGNPNVSPMLVFRMNAHSVSSSKGNLNPFVLLGRAACLSSSTILESSKTIITLQGSSSSSKIVRAVLTWGLFPQVIQVYRLSPAGVSAGVSGLSVVFAGCPMLPQQYFNVSAAISAAAAQGASGHQFQVADNALKAALDKAPYIERVS